MGELRHRRPIAIAGSLSLVVVCGGMTAWTIKDNCSILSRADCHFLWGVASISILGGILLLETLIGRQKARGEWQAGDLQSNGPSVPTSWLWYRSVVRVILVTLLAGLPLIVKGALGLAIFGTLTGMFLAGLVRGIMNWLPPIEEDTEN